MAAKTCTNMNMNKLDQLLHWAQKRGASIPDCVKFSEVLPGNIGAHAPTSDSLLLKVPTKIIFKLSDTISAFDFDVAALLNKTRNINAFSKLHLAHERSRKHLPLSEFGPYVATLPSSKMINSPYVWLPQDQKLLTGTNLGNSLKENLSGLVEEWWLVISLLPDSVAKPELHYMNIKFYYEYKFYEPEQLHDYLLQDNEENWTSFPAYLWALMIYKSRSFPSKLLQSDSTLDKINFVQDDVAILIPVIDLLNHNPKAEVIWGTQKDEFVFETTKHSGGQLFNNYGRKGNEELLLAYGFCIPDNSAESVALKIKVPLLLLPQLEQHGLQLPTISDYTTSVIQENSVEKQVDQLTLDLSNPYNDGLLYFISKDVVPESLVKVFQWLVKTPWEEKLTLRMKLSGLNHLRKALESKALAIDTEAIKGSVNADNINIYLSGQNRVLKSGVTQIKHLENELLSENKSRVISLKSVYKKDIKFAQSLMVTMGITGYNDILEQELMDQVWLIYLIRCYNKTQYKDEDFEAQYLPDWIRDCFIRMDKETEVSAQDVVQFRDLYEGLIIPMNQAVPEIYNKGKWTVRELVVSTKLLDTIGFVRGKKQECLLVDDFTS